MADISEYIDAINTAVRGEDVRDAIISAIELINQNRNAYTLNGHRAEYFAKSEDLEKIYPLDEVPAEGSTKGVTSGGLYSYIWEKIGGTLNRIIGEESGDSITDRLQTLVDIKKEIKQAIKFRGTDPEEAPFTEYADLIKNLSGVDVSVSTLSISSPEKKEYEAGEKKAYDKVSVNITYSEGTDTLTKGIIGNSLDPETYSKEFDIKQEPDYQSAPDNRKPIGYSKVTVDVSDKIAVMSEPILVDANDFGLERVYEASEDGLFGWSKITVKVVEDEGPHKVTFYKDLDKSNKLYEKDNVPHHGFVRYEGPSLDEVADKGYVFKEWNPEPNDVVRDMEVFAEWKKKSESTAPGEISEDWTSIAQNGGRDIPIGSWKRLILKGGCSAAGITLSEDKHVVIMQKVAEGESGSVSTWISRNPITVTYAYTSGDDRLRGEADGYPHSDIRTFLREGLKTLIESAAEDGSKQGSFANAIYPVTKWALSYPSNPSLSYKEPIWNITSDEALEGETVWLLSAYEATGNATYEDERCTGAFKNKFSDSAYCYVDSDGNFPDLTNLKHSDMSLISGNTWLRTAMDGRRYILHPGKTDLGEDANKYYIYYKANTAQQADKNSGAWAGKSFSSDTEILRLINMAYLGYTSNPKQIVSSTAYSFEHSDVRDIPSTGHLVFNYRARVSYPILFGFCTG